MKKIIFVCNSPKIAGLSSEFIFYKNRVKKYCDSLRQYFIDENLDYMIEVDTSQGDIDKLIKDKYEVFIFIEGMKKRFWLYSEEIKKIDNLIYYIKDAELYENDISKFVKWLNSSDK